jgi:hypothetical protein
MKYLNKKTIFSTLMAAVIMFSSCRKESLDPVPQTVISDASAFASPDRVLQQVFGVYSAMKSGQFLGGRSNIYHDIRSEEWVNVDPNAVTGFGVWNFSLVSTDNQVENQWTAGYTAINRANILLAGLDANPTVVNTTLANRFRGEVRFCRALAYFHLVNFYGRRPFNADNGASPGVPLRLTGNSSNAGAALARSSVAEVYRSIINDLHFAEANLPLTYMGTSDSNTVRAHRNAAIALKSRIFMHVGRWDSVIIEANKLVPTSAPFVTASGVAHRLNAAFLTTFRTYNTTESIFSFPMTVNNNPGTQNGISTYYNAPLYALNPSGIMADAGWRTADARRALIGTAAPFRYTKFNSDNDNYVPVIRYAEVMLNLAEALARTNTAGVDARALALLNAVRQRSDAGATLAPTTNAELLAAILNERRIEFISEGIRGLDILRQNIAFPAKGTIAAVPPTSLAYVWPIPFNELAFNSLMTPNQ